MGRLEAEKDMSHMDRKLRNESKRRVQALPAALDDATRGQEPASPLAPKKTFGIFAGVGGIELGLSRFGHEPSGLCEIDGDAACILEQRFRGVKLFEDVRLLRRLPRDVELVAAGFPCQDLSQAGHAKGIRGQQSRLIWQVFRLLEERPVEWVLIENVSFMLRLNHGRGLKQIVRRLEGLGYSWAYRVVRSDAFGVPQRRERIFLVASLHSDPRSILLVDDAGWSPSPVPSKRRSFGFYWTEGTRGLGAAVDSVPTLKGGSGLGIPSPPAIMLPTGSIVTPDIRDAERLQGFDADWTRSAPRKRWRLIGNAVTVDVAAWLGYRLRVPVQYCGDRDIPLGMTAKWPRAAWGLGGDRRAVLSIGEWPVRLPLQPIERFLRFDGRPLSFRATDGFYRRLRRSRLSRPIWFDARVETHLRRMASA